MTKAYLILLFLCIYFGIFAQLSKEMHLKFISENTGVTHDSLVHFQKIYFVRFDYCGATQFCGKVKFVELLNETTMPNTLFVVDTALFKSELPSIMNNKQIVFVNREKMKRSGLFSGHTALIESKKKKVKWLE